MVGRSVIVGPAEVLLSALNSKVLSTLPKKPPLLSQVRWKATIWAAVHDKTACEGGTNRIREELRGRSSPCARSTSPDELRHDVATLRHCTGLRPYQSGGTKIAHSRRSCYRSAALDILLRPYLANHHYHLHPFTMSFNDVSSAGLSCWLFGAFCFSSAEA